jgi:hypothetical protein
MLIQKYASIVRRGSRRKRTSTGVVKCIGLSMGIICGGAVEKGTSMPLDVYFKSIRPERIIIWIKMTIMRGRDRSNVCAARILAISLKNVLKTQILGKLMTQRMRMPVLRANKTIKSSWLTLSK